MLLVQNYIFFTLLLVTAICGIIIVAAFKITGTMEDALPKKLAEYDERLAKGDYEAFPSDSVLGTGGYIEIYDEKGNIKYSSLQKEAVQSFTAEELEFIPKYGHDYLIQVSTLDTDRKGTLVFVNLPIFLSDGSKKDEIYVFDDNYKALYSSVKDHERQFTKKQYELLTNSFSETYSIQKHIFKSNMGNDMTMVIFSQRLNNDTFLNRIWYTVKNAALGFAILYFSVIILFIMWLNRKVRKPLVLLKGALNDFAKGKRESYLDYKGPREFVEICDSFNNMSQRLYESEKKQKELEQEKQEMLADISHDLKTPITVIQGYANAINDGLVSENERDMYLEIIAQKTNELNELINVFYEYSKMEHPDFELNLRPIDICVFLRDYMAQKYNELTIAGFEVDVDIPENHIVCNIDKIQMQRAFENIISNSVKHNDRGTMLYCLFEEREDTVRIVFADNGYGIPKQIMGDVFKPFAVGEKSRGNHGSGLGLSVSKKIIEAHGGDIRLVDPCRNGYKTEFEIIIPIYSVK